MKRLKSFPIEIYTIILPAFIIMLYFIIENHLSEKQPYFLLSIKTVYKTALLGGQKMNLTFFVLWLCLLFILILSLIKSQNRTNIFQGIKSMLFLNIFAGLASLILGISTVYLFIFFQENTVLEATLLIDKIEKVIFGNLPAISFINLFSDSIIEVAILYSYHYLFFAFSLALIILSIINKKIFRQTFTAFFIAFVIAIPFFIIVPATSPDGLYIANIFKIDRPALQIKQSTIFHDFNDHFHQIWIDKENRFFNVSSIPSLHAAWGLIAVLGIIKTRKKLLAIFFFMWLILNLIGTFYSLQHYAIDTIAGTILGIIAFWLAYLFIKIEEKYFEKNRFDCYKVNDLLIESKNKLTVFSRQLLRF